MSRKKQPAPLKVPPTDDLHAILALQVLAELEVSDRHQPYATGEDESIPLGLVPLHKFVASINRGEFPHTGLVRHLAEDYRQILVGPLGLMPLHLFVTSINRGEFPHTGLARHLAEDGLQILAGGDPLELFGISKPRGKRDQKKQYLREFRDVWITRDMVRLIDSGVGHRKAAECIAEKWSERAQKNGGEKVGIKTVSAVYYKHREDVVEFLGLSQEAERDDGPTKNDASDDQLPKS